MATEEITEAGIEKEFADIIRKKLNAQFQDELTFGPIRVRTGFDLDGERYLHTYIVFEGDQEKLDPAWTVTLSRILWPHARELGFPSVPMQSFVEKSEWQGLRESL